jgi:arginyl-tRNA--protein-N-Asp/Glu arginylyltransferase
MSTVFTYITPPSACAYLPDRLTQLRYATVADLSAPAYMHLMAHGWRRFGSAVFRPECPSCSRCLSLRVPVHAFRPSESQRRAWQANRDALEIRIGAPAASPEAVDLFERFHNYKQAALDWPERGADDLEHMVRNPFPTEAWSYYLGDRLLAIGYVDALPGGLSAIYFFYDPDERRRSLGTFNVLSIIDAARRRGLPHAYLGYYVEGCRSLEYKARFRPNEILSRSGWEAFVR